MVQANLGFHTPNQRKTVEMEPLINAGQEATATAHSALILLVHVGALCSMRLYVQFGEPHTVSCPPSPVCHARSRQA